MPGRLDQPAERKTSGDAENALEACTALEAELAELRAAYEQYFLGVERHPPNARHEALKRRMQELKGLFVRQTAVKFRIQTLSARLTTFERLWDRSLKEIEAGTYRRDLLRAKRHRKERPVDTQTQKKPAAPPDDLDLSKLDDDLDSAIAAATSPAAPAKGTQPSPPVAVAPPPPPPSVPPARPTGPVPPVLPVHTPPSIRPVAVSPAPPVRPVVTPPFAAPSAPKAPSSAPALAPAPAASGLTDQKIKAIYDAYVLAKRRCGEDTKGLTLDSVASTLRKQVPELMKQHRAKSVEFKVVIKDGRAVLRALPRDS